MITDAELARYIEIRKHSLESWEKDEFEFADKFAKNYSSLDLATELLEARETVGHRDAQIVRLIGVVQGLRQELATIEYAAHMPPDYEFGLPSWINQVLYHNYIGLRISPEITKMIEDGSLTFPNSPAEKELARLREESSRA